MIYIVLYLAAIVIANITVTLFGPGVSIVNAFLFIGLDLTARDKLHESWQGKRLLPNMTVLIAVGSLLSWALNRNAGPIALASFVAFSVAAIGDTITYHLLRDKARLIKINGSNVISAGLDSLIFPVLAFGFPLLLWVMLGQFVAKVGGGFVWSLLLRGRGRK